MGNKKINLPSPEAEKELHDIVNDVKTEVVVRDTTYKIGGIYNDTLDKITSIAIEADAQDRSDLKDIDTKTDRERERIERRVRIRDRKVSAKCMAAAVLNGYFRLRLLWWFVWRWYYYIRQYTDAEMTNLIVEIKKKVDLERTAFLVNTTFLTDIRTTSMTMTRKEASRIRQELLTDGVGQQQSPRRAASSSPTSPHPDTSSSDSSRFSNGVGVAD